MSTGTIVVTFCLLQAVGVVCLFPLVHAFILMARARKARPAVHIAMLYQRALAKLAIGVVGIGLVTCSWLAMSLTDHVAVSANVDGAIITAIACMLIVTISVTIVITLYFVLVYVRKTNAIAFERKVEELVKNSK